MHIRWLCLLLALWSLRAVQAHAIPSDWLQCSNEGGLCAFVGTREVAYGSGSTFTTRTLTGGTPCTNAVFGDPVPGAGKVCYLLPPATLGDGRLGLAWDAPPPAVGTVLTGYTVYRCPVPTGATTCTQFMVAGSTLATAPTMTWDDRSVTTGKRYCYVVATEGTVAGKRGSSAPTRPLCGVALSNGLQAPQRLRVLP